MITIYYTDKEPGFKTFNNINGEDIYKKIIQKSWIHLTNPTDDEVSQVASITNIPEEMIRTTLDKEETAHIDIEDESKLVVVDMPVLEVDSDYPDIHKYFTTPFGIIFNSDYYVTTCLREMALDHHVTTKLMRHFETDKHIKLTIQILYKNATLFVSHLKQLDRDSDSVQNRLHQSLKNKELFELMSLGKSLVYLSTGINADNLVLEKIRKMETFKESEDDSDLIEDAITESRQAMEMCSIHRDILNGTMDAFASVISNNVNTVMKTLTVVTIVLTIPTLIASFFGMNVDMPFEKNTLSFWLILSFSVIFSIIGALFLIRYTSKIRQQKQSIKRRKKRQ